MTLARRILVHTLAAIGGVAIGVAAVQNALDSPRRLGDITWLALAIAPSYLLAVFLVRHRPDHPQTRRLILAASTGAVAVAIESMVEELYQDARPGSWYWLTVTVYHCMAIVGAVATAQLIALYPDGAPESPRLGLLLRVPWVLLALPVLLLFVRPTLYTGGYLAVPTDIPNPLAVERLAFLAGAVTLLTEIAPVVVLLGLVVLLVRYRRAGAQQQALMRWMLYSMLVAALAFGLAGVVYLLDPRPVGNLLFGATAIAGMLVLPLSIIVGVLRYRLFDLDLVVRRSVVYALLWSGIAAVYALLAAVPGLALRGRVPVELAVLLTILVAMAFQPLRRRVEGLADRWVFGRRTSRYQLLRSFGSVLEESIEPADLLPRLAAAVQEGLGASWVRVALGGPDGAPGPAAAAAPGTPHGTAGTPSGDAVLVEELRRADELLGRIECGPKDGGYTAEDSELLASLARQAGPAIANLRLSARLADQVGELARSRTRIVTAQDAERRRIERNIHDGAQQSVVALIAKLRLARNRLDRGEPAGELLAELQGDARELLVDLRELAHGIHPPVLSDNGLVAAVEARAGRLPVPVVVRADAGVRDRRLDQDVEGAAYFVICEALTNVVKHASASRAEVALARTSGDLIIDVSDDGIGLGINRNGDGHPNGDGIGLVGLRDRVEALGGRVRVTGGESGGALVHAELPVTRKRP